MLTLRLLFRAIVAYNQSRKAVQSVLEAEGNKVVQTLVGRLNSVIEHKYKACEGQARHIIEFNVLRLTWHFIEKHRLSCLRPA